MQVGVTVYLTKDVESNFQKAMDFGVNSCQLICWELDLYTQEYAQRVMAASKQYGVEISACWLGWCAPKIWNLVDGPLTLGLLPTAFQLRRIEELKRGSDFAKSIGVDHVVTHVGFIPEQPNEAGYANMIVALRDVAAHCRVNGQIFLFETGQETPITLLRAIEDIGLDNLGVNFDPANLMIYGKGNPMDGLLVLGKYIMGVHAKDGGYPSSGRELGVEYPLGEGLTDYPAFLRRLRDLGYTGPLTIEREIKGPQQERDIRLAITRLKALLAELNNH